MAVVELKHPILTDRPAVTDGLDFQPYADSLAELDIDEATSSPLTLGVFGRWGQRQDRHGATATGISHSATLRSK